MNLREQAEVLLNEIYSNPRLGVKLSLGNGCERIAYKLTEELAVKIDKGAMYNEPLLSTFKTDSEVFKYSRCLWDNCPEDQTELEIAIYNGLNEKEKKVFNPILAEGKFNGKIFTISPIVKVGRECGGYNLRDLCNKVGYDFDYDTVLSICHHYGLCMEDIYENRGNYGINSNGEVVIIDYGLIEV